MPRAMRSRPRERCARDSRAMCSRMRVCICNAVRNSWNQFCWFVNKNPLGTLGIAPCTVLQHAIAYRQSLAIRRTWWSGWTCDWPRRLDFVLLPDIFCIQRQNCVANNGIRLIRRLCRSSHLYLRATELCVICCELWSSRIIIFIDYVVVIIIEERLHAS